MAHRALILAALSEGSTVYNIGSSRDVEVTLDCLERLGASVKRGENFVTLGSLDPYNIPENTELYCHESGSTLRFILPLCMLSKNRVKISGAPRLMMRPLTVYETLCKRQGIEFIKEGNTLTLGGGLANGEFEVPGDVSSQFITGLLIAFCVMKGESTLTVTGRFESEPYVNMTLSVLEHFGVRVERQDRTFTLSPSRPKAREYTVEGDYSSTAFLEAFNLISGDVTVTGLVEPTLQGDAVYREYYKRLSEGYDTFDLTDCPDLAPILFALSSALHGGEFQGTARLKIKESDRAEAMREELSKLGVKVEVYENRVVVHKGSLHPPSVPIYSHNDHRIAMAMTVLLTLVGGEVEGAEAVSKSFPDFYKTLEKLNIGLEYYA